MMMLPYPPSTNRYWRNFRGMMVRSKEAIEYKELVQQIASSSGLELRDGCVHVQMSLHPALPQDWVKRQKRDPNWALGVRRIDLDNAQKVALDALQGIAYENDRQVTRLSIALGTPIEGGGLSVLIEDDEKWKVA